MPATPATPPERGRADSGPGTPPAATAGPPDGSRIHDIGYRHYDGERLGRGYIRRSLFVHSLRGAWGLGRSAKSKVLPALLLAAMCLPASIIVAVTVYAHLTALPVPYTRYALLLQAVIGLYLAAQAPQSVSRDLRFRTVPLYFSRPLERIDYVAAKFAAMSAALFILTSAPLVILYAGALLAKLDFATQSAGFGKALLASVLLSLLLGGIGLVVAALTPRRGFGVAAVIALLALSYGAVGTVQAVAFTRGHTEAIGWLGLFSPISLIDGLQTWWLGAKSGFVGGYGPPNAAAGTVYLLVVIALIGGSFALLMRRYAKVGLG